LIALVLAELVPEQADALWAAAGEIAVNREIAGVQLLPRFPSSFFYITTTVTMIAIAPTTTKTPKTLGALPQRFQSRGGACQTGLTL
jgi:hypothetical protein